MLKTAYWNDRFSLESAVAAVVLIIALVIGLATAKDYGTTIDEFNTNDYGRRRSLGTPADQIGPRFETVEFSLWYYGPWFQIVTAAMQSLGLAEPLAVRHALTFVAGLLGVASVYPIGSLSSGPGPG